MKHAAQRRLLDWYDAGKRDLPWRRTSDPYAVWVSEVMLQQTQIATVLPYYERWMIRFPTVGSLAVAEEQEVLALWQGLGYYRRCRMLLAGARFIVEHGRPTSAREWRKVPGVGQYTAGAIASIALGERTPVVDGNVERVFARYTGCEAAGRDLHKAAWKWAADVLCENRPGDWNQALMELGACACRPADAACDSCPLADGCQARAHSRQAELPKRPRKVEIVRLQEIVWIPYHSSAFGVRQIAEGEWWQGMWEFPRVRVGSPEPDLGPGNVEHAGEIRYQVTNHKVSMVALLHHSERPSAGLKWVPCEEMSALPLPAPQRRALHLALRRLSEPTLL